MSSDYNDCFMTRSLFHGITIHGSYGYITDPIVPEMFTLLICGMDIAFSSTEGFRERHICFSVSIAQRAGQFQALAV